MGALALPEPAVDIAGRGAGEPIPSEGLVVETLRMAGLLHDVGHGPFAHFFDDHVLAAFDAPADPRRPDAKRLTHEDLSQRIIEDELGTAHPRPATGAGGRRRSATRSPTGNRSTRPGSRSSIAKPALADPTMPRWVRWLAPLLSGVFTVDNLDYVRRDAYLTGVAAGPVDVERLRRYTFISDRGLTLYEPGLGALEMFLTARRFMYQQVYFHRTVRAIDLDLAEVFGPSRPSDLRRRVAGGAPDRLRGPRRVRPPAPGGALGARRGRGPGGPARSPTRGAAILLRRPTWRSEAEVRAEYEPGAFPDALVASLGDADPGAVAIDLAIVDARPADAASTDSLLALENRDGSTPSMAAALSSIPSYWLIGRRYRRRVTAAG